MQHLVNKWITLYWHKNVLECTVYIPFRCLCFKRASEMSAALCSLQAACDLRAARSITCQNKCTCFQWFSSLEAALTIDMLALALYNDNGPFTAIAAADVIWKNYRSGFLPITDSSGNQLSVPINRQNRYIGRPLNWGELTDVIKYADVSRIT